MRQVRTYKIKARPHWRKDKPRDKKIISDQIQARSKFDAGLEFKKKHGGKLTILETVELCESTK